MTRFASDIATIRDHALLDMADGPVTQAYVADLSAVITMLNDVLATELVCWLRYQQHAIVAAGIDHKQIAEQFADHAREELQHALSIAARINQLGGSPDFDPSSLACRSQTAYHTYHDTDLSGMLKENLIGDGSSSRHTSRSSAGSALTIPPLAGWSNGSSSRKRNTLVTFGIY
jgi:bacterioferritin